MDPSLLTRPFEPWASRRETSILGYIHFTSPIALLALFLVLFTAHSITSASEKAVVRSSSQQTGPRSQPLLQNASCSARYRARKLNFGLSQKSLFTWLSMGTIWTFAGNFIVVILHAVQDHWWCGESVAIYLVASIFVHTIFSISVLCNKPSWAHASTWALAVILESTFLVGSPDIYRKRNGLTRWAAVEIVLRVLRIGFLLALVFSYAIFVTFPTTRQHLAEKRKNESPCDTTPLLNDNVVNAPSDGQDYGNNATQKMPGIARWAKPKIAPSISWWQYLRGYSLFLPYIWPAKSLWLQITALFCLILVFMGRAVNVLLPYQVSVIVNIFSRENGGNLEVPWGEICLFAFCCLLQGLLSSIRSILWIPISQHSYQELSTASFEHVHSLSLDFHLEKKTGEVLSALHKGNSINKFLEHVTFQALPMLVDLVVAIGYLFVMFDAYYALVVAIMAFTHLYITIYLAHWRAGNRRQMVDLYGQVGAIKIDSLECYVSVKHFNANDYEFQRHRKFVELYLSAKRWDLISSNTIEVSQNLVFTLGLLVTCFIAAHQINIGQIQVGQFSGLVTYMAQLHAPLNSFSALYRSIQSSMINSERMLELFKELPTVTDEPSAQELSSCNGNIRFDNVSFAYGARNHGLTGLTFSCSPGTTTALVGESGSGKSTLFHLLFRFFNVDGGMIEIDGRDVNKIKIDSLRHHIGIVPQDPILFNESLRYNISYAKPSATDEEIHAACRAAEIHDRIMNFSNGYETRVGERGLKLSAGERQRVAIARAVLKNPRIILLDEATSALDSHTEQHIKTALDKLAQGRTILVIAHRLSTITTAQQILVLHAGQIIERGTHPQLLEMGGKYASMWRTQASA